MDRLISSGTLKFETKLKEILTSDAKKDAYFMWFEQNIFTCFSLIKLKPNWFGETKANRVTKNHAWQN